MSKSSWRHIDADMARGIKRLVWTGYRQTHIASMYAISQATVSRITNGLDHYDVPWPDGKTGPLASERIAAIKNARRNFLPPIDNTEDVNTDEGLELVIKKELQKALDRPHDQEEDRRLREALTMVDGGEVTEKVRQGDELDEDTPRISFTEILKKARRNPLVVAALKNSKKQRALELVFANIPEDQWSSDMAVKLTKSVEEDL